MASIDANASSVDIQETQFAPPEQVDAILNDEENVQAQNKSFTATEDSGVHLTIVQPDADNHGARHLLGAAATKPVLRSPSPRILAPDLLRGFIMLLQSIDHSAIPFGAWGHAQALTRADGRTAGGEEASIKVAQWNIPVGYAFRTSTHLCAPGFMFLLGMGVVYFGRSRAKLGWSSSRMVGHFATRALVLILLNQVLSIAGTQGFFPVLNIALLALAFNYFFVGLFWLATAWTEEQLAQLIDKMIVQPRKEPETRPLLHTDSNQSASQVSTKALAFGISFRIHNIAIFALTVVTIWWNIWFDPSRGQCDVEPIQPPPSQNNILFQFFFRKTNNQYLMSMLPPLAWISPALLGLLYGRIVTARSWKPVVVNSANLAIGLVLMTLFVLTRLLRFGNLDQSCLAMPEQLAHPGTNQYLVSVWSFFYVIKYPPSPSFMFFTMGCNFLLLALFGSIPAYYVKYVPFSILLAYGTSALFFYATHLLLYGIVGTLIASLFGHRLGWNDFKGQPAYGVGPGLAYWGPWLVGQMILWRACRWYGRFKASKDVDSIWRFF